MIAIIDYGAGNLRSVQKACQAAGSEAEISSNPKEILKADRVILPGVGAFGDCMKALEKSGLDDVIKEAVNSKKPFLGICLGMQLLFEESEESPGVRGLGILKGRIVKIPQNDGCKIPHIGWNSLAFTKSAEIFKGLPQNPYVYFVHSYYMQPENTEIITASTEYGCSLPVALECGSISAVQFHPEKSGETGLKILGNFIAGGEY